MTHLRSLAKAVADAAMGELGRRLTYKAAWYGLDLDEADRWFPSSKTCSGCGAIDRDLNAAINLARWKPPPAAETPPPELSLAA